jgi:ubiquitin-activating enzyme E1
VQVVLPKLTQSYGDSQDPPEQSIPMCTMKHFPFQIEHTIEWARESFDNHFVNAANEVNSFTEDKDEYLKKLVAENSAVDQLRKLKAIGKMVRRIDILKDTV